MRNNTPSTRPGVSSVKRDIASIVRAGQEAALVRLRKEHAAQLKLLQAFIETKDVTIAQLRDIRARNVDEINKLRGQAFRLRGAYRLLWDGVHRELMEHAPGNLPE